VPFAVYDRSTTPPVVTTGAIDLVHRLGAQWRLIDYKTDVDVGDEARQARYAEQVRRYAEAWRRVTGAPVTADVVQARSD
jgi:ATP-dependent exoDNAse (exonuclease V) beta subunit